MKSKKTSKNKVFKSSPPSILIWKGQLPWQEPQFEVRYFHRKRMEVWSGYVHTTDVSGWAGNVRIQVFVEKWKRDHNGDLPTNDDILDWMLRDQNLLSDKKPEFELNFLAESIVKNGVRQPIVLTSEGVLLDGNRRYFASLMKMRQAEESGDVSVLEMVRHLPAYVLSPLCTKEDYESVLVEENFVDDCRKPWPNYIKASKVFESYGELVGDRYSRANAIQELVTQFGLKKYRVERFIKMMNLIEEFRSYHASEDDENGRTPKDEYEIKWRAQQYFEYFDELTKPEVLRTLDSDSEFRDKVFERLYDGDFVSYTQIRKLPAIKADRRIRDVFMMGDGQAAVQAAVDSVTVQGVAKKAMDNNSRVMSFLQFLGSLSAGEIKGLDPIAVRDLEEISQVVVQMARAIHPSVETT